ncbi:MAG: sigma-70 family RNA polymerase sigma factor, partial [Clostridia bacterium]|nr:sigma-70 family RNA polymerase sigma factor [Clostridia bacterium]
GSIKAWLCVIAKRKAIDCLRARAKEQGNVSLDDEQTAVQATDTFSVEGDFEDREQRTALLQAIRDLGEPDHEILIRKFYLLQPSKVIAEKMGMSVSAVDTRTHRAIAKLRDMLGG